MSAGKVKTMRPLVAMCAGKDCRTRCEFTAVRNDLAARCDLVKVNCLGLCSGPVVIVQPATRQPVVISKVRSKQQRRDLVRLVEVGELTKALRARRVEGAKAARSIKKVRRALPKSA